MGLFGGASQSTSNVTSYIDFSPILNFGDDNDARMDKTNEQTSNVSPKQEDSLGLAASVAVGSGDAGQATATRVNGDDAEMSAESSPSKTTVPPYVLALAGGAVLFYALKKKK